MHMSIQKERYYFQLKAPKMEFLKKGNWVLYMLLVKSVLRLNPFLPS